MIMMLESTAYCEQHWGDEAMSEHHEQSGSISDGLHACDTQEDYPMCDTEEYATILLRFVWPKHTTAPQTKDTRPMNITRS